MESNSTASAEADVRGNAAVALATVFFSPTRSFQEIARGASWLWGFLVTVVLSIVAGVVQSPFTQALSRARLATLSEQQREAAERTLGVQSTMQIVLAPIGVALGLLISSLVFLAVTRVMGLGVRFKSIFAGLSYAGIITGVGGLVYAFLNRRVALAGDVSGIEDMQRFGLDLVIPSQGFVRGVLAMISVFSIWWLVVLVYGFAVLAGRTPRQASAAVIIAGGVWLLASGAMMGAGFVFGSH